jgi:predicted regulator of Ras-like GTPase activity (Roadblock/LC7/MglB family)
MPGDWLFSLEGFTTNDREYLRIWDISSAINPVKISDFEIITQEPANYTLTFGDEILTEKLIKIGVDCVIIIDMAGNIITAKDNGTSKYDVYSFAALAAGNFATVDAMAKLVGEQEFSLLFHKGTECNIHFSKIDDELLLITMFGKSISLGFLRLNVVETIERIKKIWNRK